MFIKTDLLLLLIGTIATATVLVTELNSSSSPKVTIYETSSKVESKLSVTKKKFTLLLQQFC